MHPVVRSFREISVRHLTIETSKSFEEVRGAFERDVPQFNPKFVELLQAREFAHAKMVLEYGPRLAIFGIRDHGGLLRIFYEQHKALQYEIGDPLTVHVLVLRIPF